MLFCGTYGRVYFTHKGGGGGGGGGAKQIIEIE